MEMLHSVIFFLSVSDSSPAHEESQDEVLRRRHGDKEVNFYIAKFILTRLQYRELYSE